MAYDIEKSLLGVSKLKEHFLKGLECDQSIQVSSFGSHLARVGGCITTLEGLYRCHWQVHSVYRSFLNSSIMN